MSVRFADLSPHLQEARIALMAELDLEPTSTVVVQSEHRLPLPRCRATGCVGRMELGVPRWQLFGDNRLGGES
ncbi:hypothetical protein [Saccharopolyspora sp. NPDC049357]|uniref:hypothetical protein n=1 Tax=Saccharopolyspora sp. NPDC049357 TaxID=3154507 RepID=UPI003431EF88